MASKSPSLKSPLLKSIGKPSKPPEWKSWDEAFDVESPIKKWSKSLKYILSIIVLLFVAGGIATLIFLLINKNNNDDTNDINEVNDI